MRNRFETFSGSILEMSRYVQKIKDMEMKKFGLRANHTMCLYYLGRNEQGLTVTQLTEACKEDKAAISRCLAQLSEKGLVYCETPETKRVYRMPYRLTDDGKELAKRINERIEIVLRNGSCGLSDEQREMLYRSLEIITNNLSRYLHEQGDHECE